MVSSTAAKALQQKQLGLLRFVGFWLGSLVGLGRYLHASEASGLRGMSNNG